MTTSLAAPKPGIADGSTFHFVADGTYGGAQKKFRRKYTLGSGATTTSLRLEGVPVFRSGTFRDSWGEQTEWTNIHTAEMQNHFNYLKDSGIFADVPVRKGHGSFLGDPMDSLIGYIDNLYAQNMQSPVDGKTYSYILADYDILDPEAQEKIDSGLWRNRSAEIGTFTTNDEASYSPTFMGFAYVDIPAVEGLNGAFSKTNRDFAIARGPKEHKHMATKSNDATADQSTQPPAPDDQNDAPPAPDLTPLPAGDQAAPQPDDGSGEIPSDGDAQPVQAPVGQPGSTIKTDPVFAPIPVDDEPVEVTETVAGPIGVPADDVDDKSADAPAADPVPVTELPQGPIFAKWVGNHYEIGGRVMNPTAVAELINQYQAANVAAFSKEKVDRVTALAKDNKIMATSLASKLAYAAKLGRTQFDEWISLEEAAPAIPLFAKHGNPTAAQINSAKQEELDIYSGVVAQLRLTKPDSIVKAGSAWKKGSALAKELGLSWE